jgi:hypothetical protein
MARTPQPVTVGPEAEASIPAPVKADPETTAFVDSVLAVHTAEGRDPDCKILAMITDPATQATPRADLRLAMAAHKDWRPRFSCDAIIQAATYADDAERLAAQAFWAADLVGRPNSRAPLEQLLARNGAAIDATILPTLVDALIAAGHPSPKAFLAQPAVLANLPAEVDLTKVPGLPGQTVTAPDGSPADLASLPLRGARGGTPPTPEEAQIADLQLELAKVRASRTVAPSSAEALAAIAADARAAQAASLSG